MTGAAGITATARLIAEQSLARVREKDMSIGSYEKKKQWAMLAYMAGDNNLTEEMVWGLQEMKNTLETNRDINQRVRVAALYDARGLNPSLLLLDGAGTGADGDLDRTKRHEFSSLEVFDKVRRRLTPMPEHWALAIWHHHHADQKFEALMKVVTRLCDGSKARAERFIIDLMMCDPQIQQQVLTGKRDLAVALANTTTKQLAPTDEEVQSAQKTVSPEVLNNIRTLFSDLKLESLKEEPEVKNLAYLLAEPPDAVVRNTRDLSSPVMIQDFIEDQVNEVPAEHYVVVLSGHGGGATGDFLPDEDPPSSLTIPRLGAILRAVRGRNTFDILGIDSCLMSMAEVAYEVQDSVTYLVGSQGFVANAGWPYHRVLEALAENGEPKSAAKSIVEKYAAFYQDYETGGVSTHLAAIDLRELGNLATAIKRLAGCLIAELLQVGDDAEHRELQGQPQNSPARTVRDAVILAHWYAQSFKWEKYVDLWDFCDQLLRFLPSGGECAHCCQEVKQGIKNAVKWSRYCGPDFQHAHGLSVYFPWSAQDFSTEYEKLRFAQETRWFEFLNLYLQKTQRLRRGHNPELEFKPEPWRLGSDVEQLIHRVGSPFGSKVASHFGSKVASPFGSRVASPFGSRVASPFGSRVASPFGSKVQDGKIVYQTGFKNVPDGFFRQYPEAVYEAARERFIDKKGNDWQAGR